MSNQSIYGMATIAAALLAAAPVRAEDVSARLFFRGTVANNPNRQSIQGSFAGDAEFDPFGIDGRVNGTVRTEPGLRVPLPTVFGNYPVEIYARGQKGELTVSETFSATAYLTRHAIIFRGHGRINLDRPVKPRVGGRQVLRGRGTLRYDY